MLKTGMEKAYVFFAAPFIFFRILDHKLATVGNP
jgi:hypothetical protein